MLGNQFYTTFVYRVNKYLLSTYWIHCWFKLSGYEMNLSASASLTDFMHCCCSPSIILSGTEKVYCISHHPLRSLLFIISCFSNAIHHGCLQSCLSSLVSSRELGARYMEGAFHFTPWQPFYNYKKSLVQAFIGEES